jgi:hypothetical protein
MSVRSDDIGCTKVEINIHPSPFNPSLQLASIRGLDVTEACDGYSAGELRSIARYLENIAEGLDYTNRAATVSPLFDTV